MPQTAQALSDQAAQLPPVERMARVERILDSLDVPDPSMNALRHGIRVSFQFTNKNEMGK